MYTYPVMLTYIIKPIFNWPWPIFMSHSLSFHLVVQWLPLQIVMKLYSCYHIIEKRNPEKFRFLSLLVLAPQNNPWGEIYHFGPCFRCNNSWYKIAICCFYNVILDPLENENPKVWTQTLAAILLLKKKLLKQFFSRSGGVKIISHSDFCL